MNADWLGLEGKTCVVMGAGRGIGEAIAAGLHAAGGRVAVVDHDLELAEGAAGRIGDGALALRCDISNEDDVARTAREIEAALGACDVLVNNAMFFAPASLLETNFGDWNRNLAINLTGYYISSMAFGRQMMAKGGGAIVHTGSLASEFPQGSGVDYTASKAGIAGLSRQIAIEWGPDGIRSNTVHPGLTRTPRFEIRYQDPVALAAREKMTALNRVGQPIDIANAAVFLASARASYITGIDFIVDGGLRCKLFDLVPQVDVRKQ
ncbi:MAG: SDR family oxidoreductase [Rhizobium sp.]|nr:SDR family oxidoreductase [Rhizobium sp.]